MRSWILERVKDPLLQLLIFFIDQESLWILESEDKFLFLIGLGVREYVNHYLRPPLQTCIMPSKSVGISLPSLSVVPYPSVMQLLQNRHLMIFTLSLSILDLGRLLYLLLVILTVLHSWVPIVLLCYRCRLFLFLFLCIDVRLSFS
jgi:hypothetical protein